MLVGLVDAADGNDTSPALFLHAVSIFLHQEIGAFQVAVHLILEGEGVYTVGESVYPYLAGDDFFFGSNEAHSITEVKKDTHILNVHFEPRVLWEEPEHRVLLALFDGNKARTHRFASDTTLASYLLRLEKKLREKPACYRLGAENALVDALIHAMRAYGVAEQKEERGGASTVGLSNAVDHINANLENKLTLSEIAAVAHMTPSYFSAVFKKYNGLSPWDYITIKRVEKAVEMLRGTDMTKLDIAEKCGFTSASHFYKAFLAVTGKRPGDYQKNEKCTP